jgi:hypothetical protein
MGAIELKMEGLTFETNRDLLKEFRCRRDYCGLFISDKDIQERNYSLWVSDYANEITKKYIGYLGGPNGERPLYGVNF